MPVSWITRAGDPRQKTDYSELFDAAKANICFLIGGRIAKSTKGLNIRGLVHVGTTTHDKEAFVWSGSSGLGTLRVSFGASCIIGSVEPVSGPFEEVSR